MCLLIVWKFWLCLAQYIAVEWIHICNNNGIAHGFCVHSFHSLAPSYLFCYTCSRVRIIKWNESMKWMKAKYAFTPQSTVSVYKIHSRLDCDHEYIDQETVSAFSNWPPPCVPRGLLLTKAKDSVLSAGTYPQQCTCNECHSVLVLINSANPLWENQHSSGFS